MVTIEETISWLSEGLRKKRNWFLIINFMIMIFMLIGMIPLSINIFEDKFQKVGENTYYVQSQLLGNDFEWFRAALALSILQNVTNVYFIFTADTLAPGEFDAKMSKIGIFINTLNITISSIIINILFGIPNIETSITIDDVIIPGCTDEHALNYNRDANQDDGTCAYEEDEDDEEVEDVEDVEEIKEEYRVSEDGSRYYLSINKMKLTHIKFLLSVWWGLVILGLLFTLYSVSPMSKSKAESKLKNIRV